MLLWFVHELFLLKGLPGEISNFLCPVLAGRILNRFSKDIGHMDDLLPLTFLDFIQVMFNSPVRVVPGKSRVPFSQGVFSGAEGGYFSLVMCPVILNKCHVCERKVWLWLGGWVNMNNTWDRSGYSVMSGLVWSSDMLDKWFSFCLPGVWCGFPLL